METKVDEMVNVQIEDRGEPDVKQKAKKAASTRQNRPNAADVK